MKSITRCGMEISGLQRPTIKKLTDFRMLWLVSASCTGMALLFAILVQATGYEVSIYISTPSIIWMYIGTSYIICIGLLIREMVNRESNNRWRIPLFILLANSLVVILMSVIRGYYAVGGDTLMHIGYVKDLTNGIVSDLNYYPVAHIIPAGLTLLGVPINIATSLSPAFWYLIYVASFYGLARFIWGNGKEVILATTLSAILLLPHGIGLVATLVAASTFPLILLGILRLSRDFNIKNLLIFLALMVVTMFTHPLALEAFIISLVIAVVVYAKNRWKMAGLAIVVAVVMVWWSGYWFGLNVMGILPSGVSKIDGVAITVPDSIGASESVTSTNNPPLLPSMTGIEDTQTIGEASGVFLLLRRFGSEIILGGIAFVSMVLLLIKRKYLYFGGLFMLFNLIWIVGWYLGTTTFSAFMTRLLYWIPTLSIILAVPLLIRLLESRKKLVVAGVFSIVALMATYSVFNIYPSPITGVENLQVTHQEMQGMELLIKTGDPDIYIEHLNSQRVSRYVGAIYGFDWVHHHRSNYWLAKYEPVGKLFSYNDYASIGDRYDDDIYLVVTKLDRELPRWDIDKLHLIENDSAASLIYKDGDEFEVWYIEGYGEDR